MPAAQCGRVQYVDVSDFRPTAGASMERVARQARWLLVAFILPGLGGCAPSRDAGATSDSSRIRGRSPVASNAASKGGFVEASWQPPSEAEIPTDSLGASIRRGLALLRFTPE